MRDPLNILLARSPFTRTNRAFGLGGDQGVENRMEFHGKQDAWLVWMEREVGAGDRMELQG